MNAHPFPRAVIFDWDNTLVESWGAIAEAINATFDHFNRPHWTLDEVKANCIRSARESFPEWFGDHWQEASDIFYARFSEVQMKNLRPLDGAQDLLAFLSRRDIPIFVVSNKNGEFLRREAAALGWTKHFISIIGATDAAKDKPAREHADHALQLGGMTADASVWFIGDSVADIACARNAECTPVVVGDAKLAAQHKVEMSFADLNELLSLLSKALR